jgi:hypothetical protein
MEMVRFAKLILDHYYFVGSRAARKDICPVEAYGRFGRH